MITEKQQRFIDYYCGDDPKIRFNATRSYMMAFNCAYNTARSAGNKLIQRADIKEVIDERKKIIFSKIMRNE